MRATPRIIPVKIPCRAAGTMTVRIVRVLLAPKASDPSRIEFGMERKNCSVVRRPMGIIIRLRANPPAQAEKVCIGTTTSPCKDANHDGWHAVQQVRGVAHEHRKGLAAELSQVDTTQESHRNADEHRDQDGYATSDNGVSQSSAALARRKGQLGEKVPIQGAEAVPHQEA